MYRWMFFHGWISCGFKNIPERSHRLQGLHIQKQMHVFCSSVASTQKHGTTLSFIDNYWGWSWLFSVDDQRRVGRPKAQYRSSETPRRYSHCHQGPHLCWESTDLGAGEVGLGIEPRCSWSHSDRSDFCHDSANWSLGTRLKILSVGTWSGTGLKPTKPQWIGMSSSHPHFLIFQNMY